jgi:hypothetical protein
MSGFQNRGESRRSPSEAIYPWIVSNTARERAAAARRAKLENIGEQVSSGELVIRKMTPSEQKKWAEKKATVEAKLTSAERARREDPLKARRRIERIV